MKKELIADNLNEIIVNSNVERKLAALNSLKKIRKYLENESNSEDCIVEAALSCWRLQRWANNNKVDCSECLTSINALLEKDNVIVIDYTGRQYDVSFNIKVVNDYDITDDSIISEMIKPVIVCGSNYFDGEVYVENYISNATAENTNIVKKKNIKDRLLSKFRRTERKNKKKNNRRKK